MKKKREAHEEIFPSLGGKASCGWQICPVVFRFGLRMCVGVSAWVFVAMVDGECVDWQAILVVVLWC